MKGVKYKILEEQRLIIRCFEGRISISDLYTSVCDSASHSAYDSSYSAIYDFRDADFKTDIKEIGSIADKVRNNNKILNKRKLAVLTNTPNQVVFGMLLENIRKTGLIDMRIFSTLESCLQFLEVEPALLETINEELKALKKNSLEA